MIKKFSPAFTMGPLLGLASYYLPFGNKFSGILTTILFFGVFIGFGVIFNTIYLKADKASNFKATNIFEFLIIATELMTLMILDSVCGSPLSYKGVLLVIIYLAGLHVIWNMVKPSYIKQLKATRLSR